MKNNQIKGNKILQIHSSWGWHQPGNAGYILTDEKIIYHYQELHQIGDRPTKEGMNFFIEERTLSDKEYETIINWLQENILKKEYNMINSRDSWTKIYVNLNNQEKIVNNHMDVYNQIKDMIKKER